MQYPPPPEQNPNYPPSGSPPPGSGYPPPYGYPASGQPPAQYPPSSPYPPASYPPSSPYPPASYPPNSGYPPSAPYPQTVSYPPSAGYPPAGTPRRGVSGRTILLIVSAVVVVAIAVVGYLRYSGPVRTVQNYLNAETIQFDALAANNSLCASLRATPAVLSQEQQSLNSQKAKFSYDLSGVTYQLVDEQFFGNLAHVRLAGSATQRDLSTGQTTTQSVSGNGNSNGVLLTLHSDGLGWCLDPNASS